MSQRPSLRPSVRVFAVATLLTTLALLQVVLTLATWHRTKDEPLGPDSFPVVTVAHPTSCSSITPAREHPHHYPTAHACLGATVTSHRTAGPAAGNPAGLVLVVMPSSARPVPTREPATVHGDHSRPRAILPHVLRC